MIEHGIAFLFDWDWTGAEKARERYLSELAGDLDPQFLRPLAIEHWALGRPQEALRIARRTRELDPSSANLAILEADYLLRTGQFDAAVAPYAGIGVDPENLNPHFGLAEARSRQAGSTRPSTRGARRRVAGDDRLQAVFAGARGEAGYRRSTRRGSGCNSRPSRSASGRICVAAGLRPRYAQLGEKESAFKYLDAAFVDRSPGLVFLKVDRAWDAVRSDPRFAQPSVR